MHLTLRKKAALTKKKSIFQEILKLNNSKKNLTKRRLLNP